MKIVSRELSVVCVGLVTAACATIAGASRPRLTGLEPSSVQLVRGNVTTIDLHGSAFDTNRFTPENTVRIGSLVLRAVPSIAGGTLIRVTIPSAVPSDGEAPPVPWIGGRYLVTVTTKIGTSDTLALTIAPPGGRP